MVLATHSFTVYLHVYSAGLIFITSASPEFWILVCVLNKLLNIESRLGEVLTFASVLSIIQQKLEES